MSTSIPTDEDNQSRKRRKKDATKTRVCYEFEQTGSCRYGEKCKFAHGRNDLRKVEGEAEEENRKLVREQTEERITLSGWMNCVELMNKIWNFNNKFRNTVVERYYNAMFVKDFQGIKGNDQYIYFHSNKLCVIGIAPSHTIFKQKSKPISISYQSTNRDLSNNSVSGKNKKGGYWIDPHSILCEVTCENNEKYKSHGCIRGYLIELNNKLTKDPSLLYYKPHNDGYIAIIEPKLNELIDIQKDLLSSEEYLKRLESDRESE